MVNATAGGIMHHERIDIVEGATGRAEADASAAGQNLRPALQVYFKCAHAYCRVLRNVEGTGYTARCPKCGVTQQFQVGPGGTNRRTFMLSCTT